MWLAPAAERPSEPDAQVEWLYGWWKRIDEWIEQQGQEPKPDDRDGGGEAQSSRGGR
jgi:hypothetical protein